MDDVIIFANGEPDGRLYAMNHRGDFILSIPPMIIDSFIEALQKHSSSTGDGEAFVIDKTVGRLLSEKEWRETARKVNDE